MARRDPSVFPFLEIPPTIRDDIYRLILKYPNLNPAFERCEEARREIEEKEGERLRPQITAEALPVLRNTTFVLDRCPPCSAALGREMDITGFIGEETLRKMERVEFRLDLDGRPRLGSWTIEMLLDVWAAGNSLRSLTVWALQDPGSGAPPCVVNLQNFRKKVWGNKATSKIRNFADFEDITLGGDIPEYRLIRGR